MQYIFGLYDIKTGQYLWKTNLRASDGSRHLQLCGGCVVAAFTTIEPNKPKKIYVYVLDAQTGKIVSILEKTGEAGNKHNITATMAGGKLFIIFGDLIEVFE